MDFSDQPIQPKHIPWKLIAIIAGGVVLAGLIMGGVFYVIRDKTPQAPPASSVVSVFGTPSSTETTSVSAESACDVAEDSEACRILKAKERAIAEKKSESCDVLTEEDKDDCYWSVARAARDAVVCEKIKNGDWMKQCADEQHASLAITTSDVALCDKIADGQTKMHCEHVVAIKDGTVCENADANCLFTRVLVAANQRKDADVCRVLDPKRSAECRTLVVVNDPDLDGIDSTQEIVLYGTNPRNPDTDGDGYLDGQEVNAGYDPLKK
ncbi:hypothetical protein A2318_02650 [Candidatus Uhrbacteria bacterium RIFOXYB2_FULL_45_11]|uniref:EF-hand domain-containing protein n=1 Tax=Candidatus Uhrbacteria bacterium RIFOXYB2_FULL_45_11 TaxID=1802421 RepID=A0A1F7W3G1_9BACT|nr:MAG: hypothetical protein A2318_02650 [Candidatus Uhrbacteria bacterium RIFOXYB2_FULL_45_11]